MNQSSKENTSAEAHHQLIIRHYDLIVFTEIDFPFFFFCFHNPYHDNQ